MNSTGKKIAVVLYFIWASFLVVALTFGSDLEGFLINALRSGIDGIVHNVQIDDVVMDVDVEEPFMVGKYITPKYTVKGRVDGDAGLRFKSLDDTIKSVGLTTGSFMGVKTEKDQTEGRIEITSIYDLDFRKELTLRFEKKYPQEVTARYIVKSQGAMARKVYLGIPMYAYISVAPGETYSERDFEVVYDERYFEEIDTYIYRPIKETPEGEEVSLSYVFKNGKVAQTQNFTICATPVVEAVDEIRLGQNNADGLEVKRNSSQFLTLYKDGKRVYSDYELSFSDPDAVKEAPTTSYLQFTKIGPQTITVRLPNGFEKSFSVNVYDLIKFPEITPPKANEGGMYECAKGETIEFSYEFEKGLTYMTLQFEYDKTVVTLLRQGTTFSFKGLKPGETEVKIVLDNGVEHFEESYKIKVNPSFNILEYIKTQSGNIVGKVLGHFCGFMVLAFFSMNMARYMRFDSEVSNFVFLTVCGLAVALLTEMLQMFMPMRSPLLSDVIVDMGGFYLGLLLASVPLLLKSTNDQKNYYWQ